MSLPKKWKYKTDASGRPQWVVAGTRPQVVHVLRASSNQTLCGKSGHYHEVDITTIELRQCARCLKRIGPLVRPGGRLHVWSGRRNAMNDFRSGATVKEYRKGIVAPLAEQRCRTLADMSPDEIAALEQQYGVKVAPVVE